MNFKALMVTLGFVASFVVTAILIPEASADRTDVIKSATVTTVTALFDGALLTLWKTQEGL